MPFAAILLLIATLCPLVACVALLPMGKRLGTPLAGYIATFFIVISFLCSGWGMLRWIGGGNYNGHPFGKLSSPVTVTWRLFPIGTPSAPRGFEQDHAGWLDWGIYIDSLTLSLFVTVTLAAMLVHIFAARSLRRDPRYPRFFASLALACFATLALFLSSSVLQMVILLELLGFACSMLLAFRTESDPAVRAAGKLFLVTRVGDLGLFLGIGILIHYVGNLSLPDLWLMLGGAGGYHAVALPGGSVIPPAALTAAGVALFFGAAARCAQFPLHVWAGDAAEGIAPAAAMVVAVGLSVGGVYLIARLFPLFTPSARLLIAIVGTTTLAMASLIAAVQSDIKRAVVLVGVGQLGYMMLGIGVGSWAGAMFHLVSYIFFQLLLFLAAGAVIRATRGETQLGQFGGLFPRMPVTAIASAAGVLAVCGAGFGAVGLSGFFSRGLILQHAGAFAMIADQAHRSGAYWALFVVPVLVLAVVSFGIVRWWMLIFAGPPRDRRLHEHAREVSTLFWPMVILAIMTMLAGNWLGVRDMLESSVAEARQMVQIQAQTSRDFHGRAAHAFEAVWSSYEAPDEEDRHDESAGAGSDATATALLRGKQLATRWAALLSLAGAAIAIALYAPGPGLATRIVRLPPINWINAWLTSGMYFDELYAALFVTIPLWMAAGLDWFDRAVVDRLTRILSFTSRG